MKKNVAGQKIGAQMVSATDGSAFTGAVTVYVTGDAGTQAVGSVGSGACTHEGNGFHTYAPAQAETNYDHIGFTFVGTGAIPTTIQVFTNFPQTGDAYATAVTIDGKVDTLDTNLDALIADIGSNGAGLTAIPWNASWDAEVQSECADALTAYDAATGTDVSGLATAAALAVVDANVDAILVDTDTTIPATLATIQSDVTAILADTTVIGAAGAGLTAIPWNIAWDAEVQSEVTDALNAYDPPTNAELVSEINAVQADIAALNDLDAAGVRAAVGLASANLDTQIGDLPTNAELATALGTADDAVLAAVATVDGNVDAIKAKTDSLTFTIAGQVDSNVQYVNDVQVIGDGQSGTEWGPA